MGLFDIIRGLKDIDVTGKMHVGTLRSQFKESFGTELRVYKSTNTGKGSRPAPIKSTLASICEKKLKPITIKKNHTVGDIEQQFKDQMGIGIQIMLPDGEKFAPNNMKLKDVGKS
jgi:hypothetical protein